MTDAEIKKALECCNNKEADCRLCILWTTNQCTKVLGEATIDLINRQQAEIERLQKKAIMVEAIEDSITPLPFETDYDKAIEQAKAEAIKEFAEIVEQNDFTPDYCHLEISRDRWDEIKKEMVGDAE